MAVDKNGRTISIGARVRVHGKAEHVVNGYAHPAFSVGSEAIAHAKFVAFSSEVEVIDVGGGNVAAASSALAAQDQSIVWGNGQ